MSKEPGALHVQLVDINGKPMVNKDGSPNICDKPDFMSLIQAGGKVFMINQFECRPAAMYMGTSKIAQMSPNRGSGRHPASGFWRSVAPERLI